MIEGDPYHQSNQYHRSLRMVGLAIAALVLVVMGHEATIYLKESVRKISIQNTGIKAPIAAQIPASIDIYMSTGTIAFPYGYSRPNNGTIYNVGGVGGMMSIQGGSGGNVYNNGSSSVVKSDQSRIDDINRTNHRPGYWMGKIYIPGD